MAVYGQLLIDAGGGVIDRAKQSEQHEGATLIIGLGGTGTDAVMKVKREMYKQLKPDDENSVIPRYDSIRYLVVDSDPSKLSVQSGNISDVNINNEFFNISNDHIRQTFEASEMLDNRPEIAPWLRHRDIYPDDASAGAGGIRAVGRYLLVDKAESLYRKILTEMKTALTHAKNGDINVHICAGISGGTGSGTFIDVCYLVKTALKEIGKGEARVCGYFFLPDVNLSVPEVGGTIYSKVVEVNGYAALQELDYCMNYGNNKDRFRMNYGFKEIDTAIKPVDLCYLISTTDSSGKMISDGYKYAMGVVADHIIEFLATVKLPSDVKAGEDNGITLVGHIANLGKTKSVIRPNFGATIDYNILGAAIAEMPLSEIATYLGSKLFEAYRDIYDKAPFEKDVKDFLMNSQLQYEDIRAALINGCAPKIQWGRQFDAERYKINRNGPFIHRADDEFYDINHGIIVRNKTTMIEKLGDIDISSQGTSMISRVFKNLFDSFVTKIEY